MLELIANLQVLLIAAWNVIVTLLGLILPWTPLIAWIGYWLFAVNWVKVREVMISGGWIGVVLLGLMMVLVWSVVAPPISGSHHMFGLHVSNFVGKSVYVTSLLTIMFLCGSVQLSGACGSLAVFKAPEIEDEHHDHGGHEGHGHGHESHEDHGSSH